MALKDKLLTAFPQLRNPESRTRSVLVYALLKNRRFRMLLLEFVSKPLFLSHGGAGGVAFVESPTFAGDGFATSHDLSFTDDLRFVNAFHEAFDQVPTELAEQCKRNIMWRAHICTWGARQAAQIEGDFVELGVWYGVLSMTICNDLRFDKQFHNKERKFYLVDSFGQMPGSHPNLDYQEDIYRVVQERFQHYKNVEIVRGLVPEILPSIPAQRVAYLAIDMNGSVPERAALEYFYDKLSPGAFVYLDDYGWGYPGLRQTVDEFLSDKPESLLHFPSGNSIFIKC
jgi:O-methyltransferase